MTSPYRIIGDPALVRGPFIFTCEHASNRPVGVTPSADDQALLDEHWGYDIGIARVCERLAELCDSVAVLSDFSRLVIDPNRPLDHETLVVDKCGDQPVSFNRDLSLAEMKHRIETLYVPYHDAIDRTARARLARGPAHLVSMHSFTPEWFGNKRAMEIGILFDEHVVHAERIEAAMKAEGFAVALNEPYSGMASLFVYSILRHGRANGVPFIEIEVRNDLIREPAMADRVAERIARALEVFAPGAGSVEGEVVADERPWWQVRFEVPAELADAAAWLLAEGLDLPVEVQDESTMHKAGSADPAVVIGLPSAPPEDIEARITAVLAQLGLPPAAVQTRRRTDNTWRDGWKAFFRGARLSERIAVHPPWERPPAAVPAAVVIDPGMAFGTGTHETTRGVIKALDDALAADPSTAVLDVGCGSAILAIAAALLGHRAVGVEIDGEALDNARRNIARNRVGDRVELVLGSADAVAERFGVVVANILASTLIEIASQIIARCAPGGALILSGVLAHQFDAVRAAYADFALVERRMEGEWVIAVLRAPA